MSKVSTFKTKQRLASNVAALHIDTMSGKQFYRMMDTIIVQNNNRGLTPRQMIEALEINGIGVYTKYRGKYTNKYSMQRVYEYRCNRRRQKRLSPHSASKPFLTAFGVASWVSDNTLNAAITISKAAA